MLVIFANSPIPRHLHTLFVNTGPSNRQAVDDILYELPRSIGITVGCTYSTPLPLVYMKIDDETPEIIISWGARIDFRGDASRVAINLDHLLDKSGHGRIGKALVLHCDPEDVTVRKLSPLCISVGLTDSVIRMILVLDCDAEEFAGVKEKAIALHDRHIIIGKLIDCLPFILFADISPRSFGHEIIVNCYKLHQWTYKEVQDAVAYTVP